MTHDRIGLWTLLAVAVVTATVFFWTSSNYQQGDAALDTHVDAQGKLHVLGITLGESSYRQAEDILQSRGEVALYIYPQGHAREGMKLEAFFPSIADHTKVVLLLEMDHKALFAFESRATQPRQYPNGVVRMNLAAGDVTGIYSATVRELTLIPNVNVSAENLKARFGEADSEQKLDDEQSLYRYDSIGLRATINTDAPPSLHFSNPAKVQ